MNHKSIVPATSTELTVESSATEWETLPALATAQPSTLTDAEFAAVQDALQRKRDDDAAEDWERYCGARYRAMVSALTRPKRT